MIDVIIPVYKGLAETQACLESVWATPVKASYRMVVINDASPDIELTDWLRSAAKHKPMLFLENERNLGFVQTVNRGMALSPGRDVVLLNSDTEVFGDWLDRLQATAYRSPKTGTVTPFSNNATICSYPRFCEDNAIPAGWNAAGLDALFASLNAGLEIEIPTAVGFCMYIRRDCLVETGAFDADAFGLGYGEENDFCMRARESGWRHVLAEDVFVWHKGNVSFGDSHSDRKQAAMGTLKHKHPHYQGLVRRHIMADPARIARVKVDWNRLCQSKKPAVIFIGHNRGGGTDKHMFELVGLLRDQINVLLIRPDAGGQIVLQWINPGEALRLWFRIPNDYPELLSLLKRAGVCRIHLHHTIDIPQRILGLMHDLNVPWDYTGHDYYSLCPQITLTERDNRYCGERGESQCRECLRLSPASSGENIIEWRQKNRTLVEGAQRVFTPSADTADRYRHYFPEANILAVRHPEDERLFLPKLPISEIVEGEPLRIAVVGALSPMKGADLLEAVYLKSIEREIPLSFRLFGYAYRALKTGKGFDITGEYEETELPSMLQQWSPHVVWFPAQLPETYSYTLSTVLAMDLPVAATNLGAIAERLEENEKSWVLDWKSSTADWTDFFMALKEGKISRSGIDSGQPIRQRQYAEFNYHHDYTSVIVPSSFLEIRMKSELSKFLYPRYGFSGKFGKFVAGYLAGMRTMPLMKGLVRKLPAGFQRRLKTFLTS